MIRRIATYSLLALLSIACREQTEPQIVAGYIVGNPTEEQITIECDTLPATTYRLTEQTIIEGGALTEGNIAEIIFLPTEEPSAQPHAERVTADRTYPQALGRWTTAPKAQLQIDLELKPRGRVIQHQPQQALHFTSWQLSGEDEQIILHGIISLPPEIEKAEKRKKDEEPTLPQRRERKFKITARVTKQSDSNTESREVMIFRTEKGVESRLYLQE